MGNQGYERPPPTYACHMCGVVGHSARLCPEAREWEKKNVLVMEEGRWHLKGHGGQPNKRLIRDNVDGTYLSTVKKGYEQSLERQRAVRGVGSVLAEMVPFHSSMYDDEVGVGCLVLEENGEVKPKVIVDVDGRAFKGKLWVSTKQANTPQRVVSSCAAWEIDAYQGYHLDDDREYQSAIVDMISSAIDMGFVEGEHVEEGNVDVGAVTRGDRAKPGYSPYDRPEKKDSKQEGSKSGYGIEPKDILPPRQSKMMGEEESNGGLKRTYNPNPFPSQAGNPVVRPREVVRREPWPKEAPAKKPVRFQEDDPMNDKQKPEKRGSAMTGGYWSEFTKEVDVPKLMRTLSVEGRGTPGGAGDYWLTLAELCALSPTVQKFVDGASRAHKTIQGEAKHVSEVTMEVGISEDEEEQEIRAYPLQVEEDLQLVADFRQVNGDERYELVVPPGKDATEMIQKPLIRQSFGKVADATDRYMSVETCSIKVTVEGVDTELMIDDGSMINLIPNELYEMISEERSIPMMRSRPFKMVGVTGKSEELLGYVVLEVELAGILAKHLFWVSSTIQKVILGMPGIWALRMDLYWSGERRVIRINTKQGQGHQYMHLPGGPSKTFYDPKERRRVHVEVIKFQVMGVGIGYGDDEKGNCTCALEAPRSMIRVESIEASPDEDFESVINAKAEQMADVLLVGLEEGRSQEYLLDWGQGTEPSQVKAACVQLEKRVQEEDVPVQEVNGGYKPVAKKKRRLTRYIRRGRRPCLPLHQTYWRGL
jgi:hypothetical protein